jgi:hypothetical protein
MHQPLLHEVLRDIISGMTFPVRFTLAVDNGDGTFTLSGIKKIHHLQPGFTITIAGIDFIVKDYIHNDCDYDVVLFAGSNSLPSAPGTFNAKQPYFTHGSPTRKNVELGPDKIPIQDINPIIYLMEPYDTEWIDDANSAIAYKSDITLCFLSQADVSKWLTDDFYHLTIDPMVILWREFMAALKASNLFYSTIQRSSPIYHTAFGINVKEKGTDKLYFSQFQSGVSVKLRLEVDKIDPCLCCHIPTPVPAGGSFDDSFDDSFTN